MYSSGGQKPIKNFCTTVLKLQNNSIPTQNSEYTAYAFEHVPR